MPTDEEIIRALVDYADDYERHGLRGVSAFRFVRIMLDVDAILQGRNPRKLLDSMNRLSDGND